MENEKLEILEKKLKTNKILHILSISISVLAIVLSVVALSSNFIGRGNNRHMMRSGDMRQERMMMGRVNDNFNRGGRMGGFRGNGDIKNNTSITSNQ